MEKRNFYITTTLPYVNAEPHLGHALEFIQADIIARYQKLIGSEVVFNTGTDEHGTKVYRKAQEAKKDPQAYVDEYAAKFDEMKSAFNLSYTNFIRTTNPDHKKAAQDFWKRCLEAGDIYKQLYKVKYCVGCELEKTDSELVDGKCPIHPTLEIELIEEENYFFKFSKYQQPLLDMYQAHPDFVLPDFRFNEIKEFVKAGLQDFSISRLKEKMPWGVEVPDDDSQVMYVWFDALINYISTLGWPNDTAKFETFWGSKENPNAVQVAGKDNLRQQSAMWQSMLLSADLPPSKQILIHGFITSGGHKMSKSVGNVVDPFVVAKRYGTDSLRYWVAREANLFEDSDFTWEKFYEAYTANLVNGLGNLVARVLTMAVKNEVKIAPRQASELISDDLFHEYRTFMDKFELNRASDMIWKEIQETDRYIQEQEPFKKIKVDVDAAKRDLEYLLYQLEKIAVMLTPFMPNSSEQIFAALTSPDAVNIPKLFPRMELTH